MSNIRGKKVVRTCCVVYSHEINAYFHYDLIFLVLNNWTFFQVDYVLRAASHYDEGEGPSMEKGLQALREEEEDDDDERNRYRYPSLPSPLCLFFS